jgi:hypothetical protein
MFPFSNRGLQFNSLSEHIPSFLLTPFPFSLLALQSLQSLHYGQHAFPLPDWLCSLSIVVSMHSLPQTGCAVSPLWSACIPSPRLAVQQSLHYGQHVFPSGLGA